MHCNILQCNVTVQYVTVRNVTVQCFALAGSAVQRGLVWPVLSQDGKITCSPSQQHPPTRKSRFTFLSEIFWTKKLVTCTEKCVSCLKCHFTKYLRIFVFFDICYILPKNISTYEIFVWVAKIVLHILGHI